MISFARHYIARALLRLIHEASSKRGLQVFQTEVGVKYRFGHFNTNRFHEYVVQDIPFESANISFSDLLMGHDFLRNCYTLCGQSVVQSPHHKLIEEISSKTLTPDSEYVTRRRMGTLDPRLPADPSLQFLIQKCQMRQEELFSGKMMATFVTKVTFRGKLTYVIADGKHRAALVAYHNRPEALLLRVISNKFVKEPFFNQIYSYTLNMDPAEYSINQEMIKARQNGY